ncbi:MAG: uridine kinase [Acidimicrobiales bacterium]
MPAGLDGNTNPIATPQREQVLTRVCHEIISRRMAGTPLLVGIDGIDGSGKSTFADELASRLLDLEVPVVRSTVDSFHNPRSARWSKGKSSPAGFYLDSHDFATLRELLLDPMRAGLGATYRVAAFDEPSDQPVVAPPETVSGDEVLLFDGIFLCRPELLAYWDFIVFLEAKTRVDLDRLGYVMAEAPPGGTDLVHHVLRWVERIDRYSSGMRYYLDTEDPRSRANIVIDNNDFGRPAIDL